LINAVVGVPVLPFGVAATTAVPTRIRRGDGPRLVIQFVDGSTRDGSLWMLQDVLVESGNSGNHRGVLRATIEMPTAAVPARVALVDTPAIGSVAALGARETYRYLPRCDLGVLIVEISSAPTRDDIDLLHRLFDQGIDAHVVLSKCDTVSQQDRERVRARFTHAFERALGRAIDVHLVSAHEPRLARTWFSRHVAFLASRTNEHIAESAGRKVAALQGSAIALLRGAVARAQRPRCHCRRNAATRARGGTSDGCDPFIGRIPMYGAAR
jgi:hypothetical protein